MYLTVKLYLCGPQEDFMMDLISCVGRLNQTGLRKAEIPPAVREEPRQRAGKAQAMGQGSKIA